MALCGAVVWALWPPDREPKDGSPEVDLRQMESVRPLPVAPPAPTLSAHTLPPEDEWELLARRIWSEDLADGERPADIVRFQTLSDQMLWTPAAVPWFSEVPVLAGDSFWKIAKRLREQGIDVAPGFLESINQIPAARLRSGQRLKVPKAAIRVVVDQSAFRLFVVMGEFCVATFPVGLGRGDLTPAGAFTVGERIVDPPWTDPQTKRVIRFGERGHLIGSRWIGLHAGGKPTTLGIHGTVDPGSIGRAESDGCVRLHAADLHSVFDWVADGMAVSIRP